MHFANSNALIARAQNALAGGPATLSKSWDRYPYPISPAFLESASGCYVWDVDGNKFLDTVAALGPILLGHCDPEVTAAVAQQASLTTSLTLCHALEVEVAEMLQGVSPWGTRARVRFGKDGMAATNAAVRLARYMTGNQHVLASGYHGGADWYMSTTDKRGGILPVIGEYTHQVPFGDYAAFDDALHDARPSFAGMILEVPPRPWGEDVSVVADYLQHVRTEVQKHGGLLIFDEIVTGFRYPFAWQVYGCIPDILCLGKGIANGYPLSAVVGPEDLMQGFEGGNVFWSTTFGGDTIALAAAKATMRAMRQRKNFARLYDAGIAYGDTLHNAIKTTTLPVELLGNHARMILRWDDAPGGVSGAALKTFWVAKNIERGVLYGGPIFPMVCWTERAVTKLVDAACEVFMLMDEAVRDGTLLARLACAPITDVFNTRYREVRQ